MSCSYHTTGRRQYPNAAKDHVLGLCTGSLAAAAVCGSGSVAELIPAGVEAVLLAFRIGVKVSKAGQDIESCHSQDAWTIATGLAEDEVNAAIECFSAAHRLPPSHRPYISSVTAANNAISGPPSVLASLIEVEPFRSTQFARLPIHAPFHARHLYTDDDVDKLLSLCNDNILERVPGQSTLISARDGCVINASSTRDLLRSAIDDMLTAPLRWDRVLQKSATLFPHGAVIHPILAPSQSLTTALSAAGIQSEVRKGAAEHSSTTGAKSKLAVSTYSIVSLFSAESRDRTDEVVSCNRLLDTLAASHLQRLLTSCGRKFYSRGLTCIVRFPQTASTWMLTSTPRGARRTLARFGMAASLTNQ